jgi:hypothetical protein
LKHIASAKFWDRYRALPVATQATADKNFELLKANPRHPSLHFKRVGPLWSIRVGEHNHALGKDAGDGNVLWFWIGTHADYDKLVR